MKNKWIETLEAYHNIIRVLGRVITWGGFLLILIAATISQGFPDGFLIGLIVGTIFAFASWFGFHNADRNAVEAREKLLAYAQGQKEVFRSSKQALIAIWAIQLIGLLGLILVASCYFYTCKTDLVRPQIIFIMIGLSIIIEQLFRKERLKGKPALIALAMLAALTIFLIGKVFLIW